MMSIREFAKRNDIAVHLRAAVDEVEHSDWSALEGLQDGKTVVIILWSEGKLTIAPYMKEKNPEIVTHPVRDSVPVPILDRVDEELPAETSKRPRRREILK